MILDYATIICANAIGIKCHVLSLKNTIKMVKDRFSIHHTEKII